MDWFPRLKEELLQNFRSAVDSCTSWLLTRLVWKRYKGLPISFFFHRRNMVVHAPVHEVCPKNSLKINISSFQPVLFGTIPSEEWAGKRMTHTQRRRFSVTVERTIPVTYLRSESSVWASSTVEHQTFIYFRWYQKRNHEPPTPIFILFKAVHLINGLGQMAWFQDNKKENVHSFVFLLLSNYSITWPFWLSGNLQNIWYVSCR